MSHRSRRRLAVLTLAVTAAAAGTVAAVTGGTAATAANGVPTPDHVVVVVFENTAETSIIGNSSAPYFNQLAAGGANFTDSHAITHPSEPNYLDLFSGSNQGVTDDSCPHTFSTANQGAQLIAAGRTFVGYSENLPSAGSTVCTAPSPTPPTTSGYARKHNPWVNFTNVPASSNQPFTAFPSDYTQLPTVSWVVPNLCNDMHDCSIATGDTWLHNNLGAYATWASTHNSLLIVTFDEDDSRTTANQITTIFYGQQVRAGNYAERIDHFSVLRTMEDMYGLPYAGAAATATSITDVWTTSGPAPLAVTNPGSQTATAGTAITPLQLAATGGTAPYSWSATGLPAGLAISSGGLITGTPTTAATYTVTARATDATAAQASTTFTWKIARKKGPKR